MKPPALSLALMLLLANFNTLQAAEVVVNGTSVPAATMESLAAQLGFRPQAGDWWYDARSGAFGHRGGPALGILPAGIDLGGALRADASGGGDGRYGGVYINGREIHPQDIVSLRGLLGQVVPGRYWVDAAGNFGLEGGYPLGNLVALAQAAGRNSRTPRGSTPSTCAGDPSCMNSRSWSGDNYFSDGKTGCIVMEGEISC